MSQKTSKVDALIAPFSGGSFDPHYLGFFWCFNQRLYFEAHEVLEVLWLKERKGPRDDFFKGLIQLAGAFVHLQKQRLGPAKALFRLARANLERYPAVYEHLELTPVRRLAEDWLARVEQASAAQDLLVLTMAPQLEGPRPHAGFPAGGGKGKGLDSPSPKKQT